MTIVIFQNVCCLRFAQTWYQYLHLLDISYEDGFQCPVCGPVPSTVVMDGVALGLRKELLSWKLQSSTCPKQKLLDGR